MWDEARHSIQGDLTRHPRVPVRPQVTELHYDKSNGSNRPTVAYLTFPGHDSGLNTPSAVKSISAWYVHAAGAHSYTVSHPLLFVVYSNFQNILFCKDFNLIGVWQFWLRELYAFTQAHQFCFEWTCVKYFNSLLMRETGSVAASSKIRNMKWIYKWIQNWLIPQRGREVSCTSTWQNLCIRIILPLSDDSLAFNILPQILYPSLFL